MDLFWKQVFSYTRLGRPTKVKHSILFGTLVKYTDKKLSVVECCNDCATAAAHEAKLDLTSFNTNWKICCSPGTDVIQPFSPHRRFYGQIS